MPNRLEMVVGGLRQAALPNAPEFISRTPPADGFFMERQRLGPFELPDHWIPFYGVGLQLAPGKRFYYQDGKYRASSFQAGDFLVLAPQELRRFRGEFDGTLVLVSIEPVVLQHMVAGSPASNPFELTRTSEGPDPMLTDLVLRLQAEVKADYPAGHLLSEAICTRLAEELMQRYSIGRPRLDRHKGGLSGAQLRRVLEFIETNIGTNLTGNVIAGVAGLSKYHFGKAFRDSTEVSLHRYVLTRRMRRAEQLLVKSDLPLGAIAADTGFSNQSHFTTVFSSRTGIPPARFRQLRRAVSVSFHTAARA